MKEFREFSAKTATGQYHLNLHVLGLNYSSTFVEMIKGYFSMARRFHTDNNYRFDTTEMMTVFLLRGVFDFAEKFKVEAY